MFHKSISQEAFSKHNRQTRESDGQIRKFDGQIREFLGGIRKFDGQIRKFDGQIREFLGVIRKSDRENSKTILVPGQPYCPDVTTQLSAFSDWLLAFSC